MNSIPNLAKHYERTVKAKWRVAMPPTKQYGHTYQTLFVYTGIPFLIFSVKILSSLFSSFSIKYLKTRMTKSISSETFEEKQRAKEWKILQKKTEKRTKWGIEQMFIEHK